MNAPLFLYENGSGDKLDVRRRSIFIPDTGRNKSVQRRLFSDFSTGLDSAFRRG